MYIHKKNDKVEYETQGNVHFEIWQGRAGGGYVGEMGGK